MTEQEQRKYQELTRLESLLLDEKDDQKKERIYYSMRTRATHIQDGDIELIASRRRDEFPELIMQFNQKNGYTVIPQIAACDFIMTLHDKLIKVETTLMKKDNDSISEAKNLIANIRKSIPNRIS